MLSKFFCLLLSGAMITFPLFAQEKSPVKYGHVAVEDFDISKSGIDTTSGAVIISDVGISKFEGNNDSRFSLIYSRQCRIKVINKNGLDLANVKIYLYQGDKEGKEQVEKLKASTYNIVNGQVVETKLNTDAIFEDKLDKNHTVRKFTMPAVTAGSIIEYSYTINSDFLFNLQPWAFQGNYPRIWSEYEADIPDFFNYVVLSQGFQPFYIKTQTYVPTKYNVRMQDNYGKDEMQELSGNTVHERWVMKDVPVLKEEKFTSSLDNFIAKIEFQMASIKYPDEDFHDVMGNWEKVSHDLLLDDNFGTWLTRSNGWLDADMTTITSGATDDLDKARKIYYYVKDKIKCNDKRSIWLDNTIKDAFNNKNGSVAEMNMLLIAMLRHEKLTADPVILSTTDNGYTQQIYPIIDKFNYVICKLTINNTDYFLDASAPYLGFGKLPDYCYNGHARVVNEVPSPLYFLADSLQETKITSVVLFNSSTASAKWVGNFKTYPGYFESSDIRSTIIDNGKDDYIKDLISSYNGEYSISNIQLDNMDDDERSIKMSYKLIVKEDSTSDIIYFNPMIKEGYSENFFKSANRQYPVEMPYKTDETFTLNMEIPAGYDVDEMPKSVKVTLNDVDGYFEYIVSKNETNINIRSRIKLNKATFLPEDYQNLRDFYDFIVKKHSEQIVFKKKK